MKNKQIIFTNVNKAELSEVAYPTIGDNEVLVDMQYTAISNGTEKANLTGEPVVGINCYDTVARFPRKLGYSGVGIIKETGKNVSKFKIGDIVATSWGVHAKYVAFSDDNIVKIDKDISLKEAAFAHISTFPMAAIRKTHLEIGESAIVMGQGLLGVIAVMLLKASGAVPIIAVDPIKERRELALKVGADFALDSTTPTFVEDVEKITNGGVNVAIEVTGLGTGLNQVLDCMAKMGRVALLGCTRKSDFTVDYYHKVHGKGVSLIGAHTFARPYWESSPGLWTQSDDKKAFLNLIKYKRIKAENIISEVHSPIDAPKVFLRLAEDKNFPIGVLFDWTKEI